MDFFSSGLRISCPVDQQCSEWIRKYLGDCICNKRDAVSITLGLISLVSWGVAEVPQIISNFTQGSTEGVSLLFLLTWTVGDIFNLTGCLLEPATIPTQLYIAVLYTLNTLILVGQCIYYEYILPKKEIKEKLLEKAEEEKKVSTAISIAEERRATEPVPIASSATSSLPPRTPLSRTISIRESYVRSARSLTHGMTPHLGSYMPRHFASPGSSMHGQTHVGSLLSQSPDPGMHHMPANYHRALGLGIIFFGVQFGTNLTSLLGESFSPNSIQKRLQSSSSSFHPRVMGSSTHRHLLQDISFVTAPVWAISSMTIFGLHMNIGEFFGWLMAFIYMGGRFPQIWLNIKRGSVEGLNPLMFLFALIGNCSYMGSILVRNTDWKLIKPNLAWLVDAGVCVVLDLFILLQFFYYSFYKKRVHDDDDDDDDGDYESNYPYHDLR